MGGGNMRASSIFMSVVLALVLGACSELKEDYNVSQRVRTKYPDAHVQIVNHSDGTRGLVVSFDVKSLSDLKKVDPFDKARELANWMNSWPDDNESWKDVTVNYKRSLLGSLITISNSETVEISSLHSI